MDPTCSSSSTLTTPTKPSISALESTPPQAKETPEERPFPFLKLSAELRNEIYSLVLGGSKAIHMRRRSKANLEIEESKRWFSKVCTEPPSRYEPFWNLTGMGHLQYDDPAGIDKDMAWAWGPIWGPCCDEGCPPGNVATTPLQVQLLRVCRQIYKEAALVPFKENVFWKAGAGLAVLDARFRHSAVSRYCERGRWLLLGQSEALAGSPSGAEEAVLRT
jgi:hypothetical protein